MFLKSIRVRYNTLEIQVCLWHFVRANGSIFLFVCGYHAQIENGF